MRQADSTVKEPPPTGEIESGEVLRSRLLGRRVDTYEESGNGEDSRTGPYRGHVHRDPLSHRWSRLESCSSAHSTPRDFSIFSELM